MSIAQRLYEGVETPRRPRRPDHLHADRLDRDRRRRDGRGPRGHRRPLRRRRTRCPRAASTRPSRRAPRRRTSRSGRPASGATRTRSRASLKPDELRLYRLIWQRALASQMAAKELETTTIELADGAYELRASATKVLFDGFARVYTEGRDDDGRRRRGGPAACRRSPRATATERRRGHADPALHRAAAALHRGDADQGARGARDRPAVDLRRHDLDDRRPRLRPGRGAPAPPGARRRDRHRPAGRAFRRLRRRRVHRPDGGGARRGRPRRARLGAAAAGVLRAAPRPRRREAPRAQAHGLHDRGDRRGLLARPPDGHPARPERPVPRLLAVPGAQGDAGRCPATSRRPRRAPARSAPSAARARWSASAAGSGRSSAARATPTATTSRRTGRRRPTRSRSRSSAPRTATATSSPRRARRTGNVFWGCSDYPQCDYTTNHEPLGGLHDADDGPLARKDEAAICLVCGSTSEAARGRRSSPGERYPGGPAEPRGAGPARAGAAGRRRARRKTGGSRTRRRPRGGPAGRRAHARGRAGRRTRDRAPADAAPAAAPPTRPSSGSSASLAARDASPHTQRAYATAVGAYLAWLAGARRRLAAPGPRGPAGLPRRARRRARPDDGRPAPRRDPRRSIAGRRANDLAPGDPWGAIATPRLPRRLPRVLEVEQVERLLAVVDGRPRRDAGRGDPAGPRCATALALRDRALVETAYAAGLRISELAAADLGSLDLRRGEIRVLGKGRKERIGLLGRPARAALAAYLDDGRPVLLAQAGRRPDPRAGRGLPEPPRRRRSASAACATGSTGCAAGPACRTASRRTRSATRSRPTCSTAAPTCGSSRSCSATRAWRRPRSTPTSRRPASGPPTGRPTRGHVATPPRDRAPAGSPGPG